MEQAINWDDDDIEMKGDDREFEEWRSFKRGREEEYLGSKKKGSYVSHYF